VSETERPTRDLEWTGERYIPGIQGDVAVEHLHRYALARELVHGKDVLDIACGEGYGSNLLIETAQSVIGVDAAEDAIAHARQTYVRSGLQFEVGRCDAIPLKSNSVDVVVSFETIEHHDRHDEMMAEISRVLRADGVLIVSSPDKYEYSDVPGTTNSFHVKELYLGQLLALLQGKFRNIAVYGQRIQYGSTIAPLNEHSATPWYTFCEEAGKIGKVAGADKPLYFIAVATNGDLPTLPSGIFADPKSVWQRDRQIVELQQSERAHAEEFEAYRSSLEDVRRALQDQVASLKLEQEVATSRIRDLKAEVKAQREVQVLYAAQTERWQHEAWTKEEALKTQARVIDSLHQKLAAQENMLAELNAKRQQLEQDRSELQHLLKSLVDSASWRLTEPLRRGKHITVGLPKVPGRLVTRGEGLLLRLWQTVPAPRRSKLAVKSFLFDNFPFLFRNTVAYRAWSAPETENVVAPKSEDIAPPVPEESELNRFANLSVAFPEVADPLVAIIVTAFNKIDFTVACLKSIQSHRPVCSFEVVLVDDGSIDETEGVTKQIPGLRCLRNPDNLGFLRSANRGASMARGKYLYFLNNDAEVQAGTIDALLEVLVRDPSASVAGSKIVYPAGHLQEAGAVLNTDGTAELVGLNDSPDNPNFNFMREVDYCSGASFMIERERFEALGGFDDTFAPAYFEDADLSLRIRSAGGRIIYQPASCVSHHLSVTTNDYGSGKLALIEQNKRKFLDRWQDTLNEQNRVRLIAFYLPQFHPIPENDEWWGEGFTEWSNVTKARANFEGHHQPHVPGILGYYDLRTSEAREAQAELARAHGIYGFCYYYYWFGGKRLLEAPLSNVLASGEPRLPFCVCWANESWTRRWDGRDSDVLMEQTYSPEDDVAFIESLIPLFSDERYIRVHGRPLLLIYRADKLPNAKCTVARWQQACAKAGIPAPYLVRVCSFSGLSDPHTPADYGFDAAVEFPPHGLAGYASKPHGTVSDFRGGFYDYVETANRFRSHTIPPYRLFKAVMPSWDNTARRQHGAHIFLNSDPAVYEAWLRDAIATTRRFAVGEERIVFVNAWNEWAEGNHLEPDIRYGYAYLNATKRALEEACGIKLTDSDRLAPAQIPQT